MKKTTLKQIKKIADDYGVRVSVDMTGEDCEGKKCRQIGLHGFLGDIKESMDYIAGYEVEQSETGWYLTSRN